MTLARNVRNTRLIVQFEASGQTPASLLTHPAGSSSTPTVEEIDGLAVAQERVRLPEPAEIADDDEESGE